MAKSCRIYVPSYKRYDRIKTYKVLNDCTYVVRKSEEDLYRAAGVDKLLVAEDELIDTFPKTRQWIIDNTPEDIVVQIDDDIEKFCYCNKSSYVEITDKDTIDAEIERVAQLLSDLNLGFASLRMQLNVIKYSSEFMFKGTIGQVCWYNKSALKGKYDVKSKFKADMDFELQELLQNRIILIPNYLQVDGKYDKNSGGNNVKKTSSEMYANVEYLKNKWGRYFEFNEKSNISKVVVKR